MYNLKEYLEFLGWKPGQECYIINVFDAINSKPIDKFYVKDLNDIDNGEKFIDKYNGKYQIWVNLNPYKYDVEGWGKDSDVLCVRNIYIDLDNANHGNGFAASQQDIDDLIEQKNNINIFLYENEINYYESMTGNGYRWIIPISETQNDISKGVEKYLNDLVNMCPNIDVAVKDKRRVSGMPGTINVKREDVKRGMINRMRDKFNGVERIENEEFLKELEKIKNVKNDILNELNKVDIKLKIKNNTLTPDTLDKMSATSKKLYKGKLNDKYNTKSEVEWALIGHLIKDGFDKESEIPYIIKSSKIGRKHNNLNEIVKDIERYVKKHNNELEYNLKSIVEGIYNDSIIYKDSESGRLFIIYNNKCLEFTDNINAVITSWVYEKFGTPTKWKHDIRDILTMRAENNIKKTYLRTAFIDNNIYYKLNENEMIIVNGDGWNIKEIDLDKVIFRPIDIQKENVKPVGGKKLYNLLNILPINKNEKIMVMGMLVGSLIENINHPILNITGDHGSGKSTISTFLKQLIDPVSGDGRSALGDNDRELSMALAQNTIYVVDNISNLTQRQSDIFAQAATGGAIDVRELYKTSKMIRVIFRPTVIINGINDTFRRADILDRTIRIQLERIKGGWNSNSILEGNEPETFGAILDNLVYVMKNINKLNGKSPIRLSDYYWVTVLVAEYNGITKEEVDIAFKINQIANINQVINESVLGSWIIENVMDKWVGSSSDLLNELRFSGNCPYKTAIGVGKELKRIRIDLEQLGYKIGNKDTHTKRYSIIYSPN